jgi:5-methyltetrahydropteroyltriglutamate--homocysteine methyltransferase
MTPCTRIQTTHTGSLPRPPELVELLVKLHDRQPLDRSRLDAATRDAVKATVERQRETGIDVVNDGEMGRVGYSTYIQHRLTGFGGSMRTPRLSELREYPEYVSRLDPSLRLATAPACDAPITRADTQAVQRDIAFLRQAVGGDAQNCFMTAASPGVISVFFGNLYYRTREEFLAAVVAAMRPEYQAIVDAGFILQLDCPDLAMGRHMQFADLDDNEFKREAALNIEALNAAVDGLPPDRIRIHLCWGNYEGPHHRDVPLREIIALVLRAVPCGLSLQGSDPRHAHEWEVFKDIDLPDGKYLIPGVIDSTSNYIDHPQLVAQRIMRYTDAVGPERVVAGSDCGFGTFVGMALVEPRIAWAKLRSLVEGAKLASDALGLASGSRALSG